MSSLYELVPQNPNGGVGLMDAPFGYGQGGLRTNDYSSFSTYGQPQTSYNLGGAQPTEAPQGLMDSFNALKWFGSTDKNGVRSMGKADYLLGGLGAIGSGLQAFTGLQQYGLAKKQFQFQKDAWEKQYAAQKGLINSELEARQNRRVLEDPRNMATAEYMAKYGVK